MGPPIQRNLRSTLGLTGSNISYCTDAVLGYPSGNIANLHAFGGAEGSQIITGKSLRVSAIATFPKKKLVAIAFSGSGTPSIQIVRFPDVGETLVSMEGGTDLEWGSMDFSRDGKLLVSLGKLPGFDLAVWSAEDGSCLVSQQLEIPVKYVSISPINPMELCISGNGHLLFVHLKKAFDTWQMSTSNPSIDNQDNYLNFNCHCWTPNFEVVLGTWDGILTKFDPLTGEQNGDNVKIPGAQCGVTQLMMTSSHVVAGTEVGTLLWFNADTLELCGVHQVSQGSYDEEGLVPLPQEITSVAMAPSWSHFGVLTGDGSVHVIINKLEPPPTFDREKAHLAEAGFISDSKVWTVHCGSVNDVACLPNQHLAITCGSDGSLRMWDYERSILVGLLYVSNPLLSMDVCTTPNGPVVAVGSSLGAIRVYAPQKEKFHLLWRSRLTNSPITAVRFSPTGHQLWVGHEDGTLMFVECGTTGSGPQQQPTYKVVAYMVLPGGITGIDWSPKPNLKDVFLFCSVEGNLVIQISVPNETWLLQIAEGILPEEIVKKKMKTLTTGLAMAMAPTSHAKHGYYLATNDKYLKFCSMKQSLDDPKIGIEKLDQFEKVGTCVAVSPDGNMVASGSADGSVLLRHITDDPKTPGQNWRLHDSLSGGVTCVRFSFDSQYLITAGEDGLLLCWNLKSSFIRPSMSQKPPLWRTLPIDDKIERADEITVLQQFKQGSQNVVADVDEAAVADTSLEEQKRVVQNQVTDLRHRWHNLLLQNEELEDDERLERAEFIVDHEHRERLQQAGKKKGAELREKMKFDNLGKALIASRVKSMCWDSMDVHLTKIKPLKSGPAVSNFPLLKEDGPSKEILEKIKTMRRIEDLDLVQRKEIADQKRAEREAEERAQLEAEAEANGEETPHPESPAPPVAAEGDEEKEAEGDEENAADEEKEGEEKKGGTGENLLYDPHQLNSRRRKLTQCLLLEEQIEQVKKKYNSDFENLMKLKHNEMSKIEERNARIREILKELEVEEEVTNYVLDDDEEPHRCLEIKDEEVKGEKWVSPEERERLDLAKQQEEDRRAANKGDNAVERALQEMMGGTLAVKRELKPWEIVLEKPDWMVNKPPEEWGEEELKAAKEFDKKDQAIKEEKEKHRKALEGELKKLREEIAGIEQGFDTELQNLATAQIHVHQEIYKDELNIIKLKLAVEQEAENEANTAKLQERLEKLRTTSVKRAGAYQDFKRLVDQYKEQLDALQVEDRQMERGFRKEFADQQAEGFLEQLHKLFKRRVRPQEEAEETKEETADPFAKFEKKQADPSSQVPEPLNPDKDFIPGLDPAVWERLVEARDAKIASEVEIKRRQAEYAEMEAHLQRLYDDDEQVRDEIEELLKESQRLEEQKLRQMWNLDLLFTLQQGQLEVEQQAVVTDYVDSIFINKTVVEELNESIQKLGQEKVEILNEIKEFRKETHQIRWTNKKLEMDADDLVLKIREFQLLRVTKNLQAAIKGGEDNRQAQEIATLQRKLAQTTEAQETKVGDKKKIAKRLRKVLMDKEEENLRLKDQIKELQLHVEERQKIHSIRTTGAESSGKVSASQRMKDVRTRRKLLDLAKAQTEDIEFLREELDRMRQRTFPSFAQLHRKRALPDELG